MVQQYLPSILLSRPGCLCFRNNDSTSRNGSILRRPLRCVYARVNTPCLLGSFVCNMKHDQYPDLEHSGKCIFRPSATKSGRPCGVMYVSSLSLLFWDIPYCFCQTQPQGSCIGDPIPFPQLITWQGLFTKRTYLFCAATHFTARPHRRRDAARHVRQRFENQLSIGVFTHNVLLSV